MSPRSAAGDQRPPNVKRANVRYTKEQFHQLLKLRAEGVTIREAIARVGVRLGTAMSWLYQGNRPFCIANRNNQFHIPESSKRMTADKAYVLGVLCGDGYLGGRSRNQIQVVAIDEEFVQEFQAAIFRQYGKKAVLGYRAKTKAFTYQMKSREIYDDLLRCFEGELPKTFSWRVPRCVRVARESVRCAFLRGFVDSEGCVVAGRGTINISSSNAAGIEDIRDLLVDLGLATKLYRSLNHQRGTTSYYLQVRRTSLGRFLGMIGLTIRRKRDAAEACLTPRK